MSRPNPVKLAVLLVAIIGLAGLPVWLRGGLYITNYEGDALHLADMLLRMEAGGRPHLDFMTPLGGLAFWPFIPWLRAGADMGIAFALGQTLFALLAGVAVWWAAWSRLSWRLAYLFCGASAVLLTSLSHGASGSMIAISMHYNRWAWVLAFVAVVLVLVPPRGGARPRVDGTVLAALALGLVFLKVTYAATFGPALLLILLLKREWRLLKSSLVAGGILGAALAVALGPAYLAAYWNDLWAAARAPIRAQPGLALEDVALSPPHLVATLTLLAGMAMLRRSGAQSEGLAILILSPVFLVVTWQNFGNDPVWLILVCILFFALRPPLDANTPPVRDPSVGVAAAGFAAFILSVPLLQNHASGGFRLMTLDTTTYREVAPRRAGMADVFMPALPADLVRGRVNLTDPGEVYADLVDRVPDHAPGAFEGASLPNCQILTGIPTVLAALAGSLATDEGQVFVADLISSHWLYGDGAPLRGAAPWNYGTLAGLDAATHVLVPLCPIDIRARKAILEALDEDGRALTVVRETPLYRLYELGG